MNSVKNHKKIIFKKFVCIMPGVLFSIFFIYKSSFSFNQERVFTLSDDVMISMSYAKNLIQNGQFTWFEGADRVQGYTNFLYTILLAAVHFFNLSNSLNALFVSLFNLLLIVLISLKVINLSQKINKNNLNLSLFLGALVAFQYPLIFWSLRGFEVGLLSFLLIVILEQLFVLNSKNFGTNEKALKKIYFFLLVGTLVRLDFVVVWIAVNLYLLLFKIRNSLIFKDFFKYNLFLSVVLISFLTLQYFYYGSFLPNTFYLKTEGFSLIEKIPRGILSSLKIFPLLLLSFLLFINTLKNKKRDDLTIPIFFISFFIVLYNIIIGGDAWEVYNFANRFITLLIPVLLLLVNIVDFNKFSNSNLLFKTIIIGTIMFSIFFFNLNVSKILGFEKITFDDFEMTSYEFIYLLLCLLLLLSGSSSKKYILSIIFTVYLSFSHISYMLNTEVHITSTDYLNTQIGNKINEITNEKAKIAVFWAGNIAYYSDRNMIDLLGKSDEFIAKGPAVREETRSKYNFNDFFPGHNKWNFEYSIGQLQPDIIVRSWENSNFYSYIENYEYVESCITVNTVNGEKEFKIFIRLNSSNIFLDKVFDCSKN